MRAYKQQARMMKALAHPVRLHILDILGQEEECVCHLTAVLGARQPYVSQQLAILREAGLVSDRREGLIVYYRLQDERVAEVMSRVRGMLVTVERYRAQPGAVESWPSIPERPVSGCPCPKCQP